MSIHVAVTADPSFPQLLNVATYPYPACMQVASVAAKVLREGVLRPGGAMLAAGLRLHASLLRPSCAPAEPSDGDDKECAGSFAPEEAMEAALSQLVLQCSSDPAAAVGALLRELLPLYQRAGQPKAALTLVRLLVTGGTGNTVWCFWGQPASRAGQQAAAEALHGVPELTAAVGELLRARFLRSEWGTAAAAAADTEGAAGCGTGLLGWAVGSKGEWVEADCLNACLMWWLSAPQDGLLRAKVIGLLPLRLRCAEENSGSTLAPGCTAVPLHAARRCAAGCGLAAPMTAPLLLVAGKQVSKVALCGAGWLRTSSFLPDWQAGRLAAAAAIIELWQ